MKEHVVTKIDGSKREIELSEKCYTFTDAGRIAYDDNGENDLIEDDDCEIEPKYLD